MDRYIQIDTYIDKRGEERSQVKEKSLEMVYGKCVGSLLLCNERGTREVSFYFCSLSFQGADLSYSWNQSHSHAHTHAGMHAGTHTHTRARTHTHVNKTAKANYPHRQTHIHTHAHTHTSTHTDTQTLI